MRILTRIRGENRQLSWKKHNENVFFSFQILFFDLIGRHPVSKQEYPGRKNKPFFIFSSMEIIG